MSFYKITAIGTNWPDFSKIWIFDATLTYIGIFVFSISSLGLTRGPPDIAAGEAPIPLVVPVLADAGAGAAVLPQQQQLWQQQPRTILAQKFQVVLSAGERTLLLPPSSSQTAPAAATTVAISTDSSVSAGASHVAFPSVTRPTGVHLGSAALEELKVPVGTFAVRAEDSGPVPTATPATAT
jgi:hypothetical protein